MLQSINALTNALNSRKDSVSLLQSRNIGEMGSFLGRYGEPLRKPSNVRLLAQHLRRGLLSHNLVKESQGELYSRKVCGG